MGCDLVLAARNTGCECRSGVRHNVSVRLVRVYLRDLDVGSIVGEFALYAAPLEAYWLVSSGLGGVVVFILWVSFLESD